MFPTRTNELIFTETVGIDRRHPETVRVRYACDRTPDGGTTFTQEGGYPESHEVEVMQLLFDAETRRCVARIKEVLENDEWTPPVES